MSVRRQILFLSIPLLLLVTHAQAQSQPSAGPQSPPKPQQVMTLRVTLPSAVGYAMRLFTKDDKADQPAGRKEERTSNPVLVFTVPVPQLLGGSKPDAAPKKN
jgi:hypothetical protein